MTTSVELPPRLQLANPASWKLKKDSPFADVVFGSAAGLTSKLVEHPFDTVKVRLQTQPIPTPGSRPLFAGPIDCFRQTIRADGAGALLRGVAPPLLGSMFEHAILFSTYIALKPIVHAGFNRQPEEETLVAEMCVSGAIAGAVSSALLTPLELVKCKQQVSAGTDSATTVALRTFKKEGFRGLFRGGVPTLWREAAGSAAWFGIYEGVVTRMMRDGQRNRDDLKAWELCVAGSAAGIGYNSALYPADVVKSIQQTEDEVAARAGLKSRDPNQRSFAQTARALYTGEGIRGFYRGFGITIARSVPGSAIIVATFELANRYCTYD